MEILFKVTTRNRPEQAYHALLSIINFKSPNPNFKILLSVDYDDPTLATLEALTKNLRVIWSPGESRGKIGSINRDVDKIKDWDILVNVSDDTHFCRISFDELIREQFNDFNGVLHLPDDNRKDLMTMSIIHRDYYELDKYIYHPDYKNLWCDNEAQDVARIRGKYKFVDELIFCHRHWAYGKGVLDQQYQEQNGTFGEDNRTYERRKAINFDL